MSRVRAASTLAVVLMLVVALCCTPAASYTWKVPASKVQLVRRAMHVPTPLELRTHGMEKVGAATPQMELASTAALEVHAREGANAAPADASTPFAKLRKSGTRVAEAAAAAESAGENATTAAPRVEPYGSPLTAGVIAAIVIAIVFGSCLVVLVGLEAVSMICDLIDNRRMRAARKSSGAENPAEPKYGDKRDTALDVQA